MIKASVKLRTSSLRLSWLANLYKRDFAKALEVAKTLVEESDADEQTFQVAGNVYRALALYKDGEKMFRKALKKFPNSGPLYSEYGEMLWDNKDYSAINQWEKGIEVDPSYPSNYYNAAKYYYLTYDKIWTLIYGEIFINLESYSRRTPEIKSLLVDGYKKLFIDLKTPKSAINKNPFAAACLSVLNDQASAVSLGITAESLSILRSKFILEWFDKYAGKFPFHLFDYERQLMKEGLFDAYNQWAFGASIGLANFQNWTAQHAEDYNRFISFQKGRVFRLPTGQNYRTETAK